MSAIAIIDYGMGNLRSVQKAFEREGASAQIVRTPAGLSRASAVVLPGVGAFGEAVRRLKAQKLWTPLKKYLMDRRPFLGICLGLQLLFERSEENPGVPGLGIFKGPVVRFRGKRMARLKVPHMGWNSAEWTGSRPAAFAGIPRNSFFYFVHSFYPEPKDRSLISSRTFYGERFCSSVTDGALFACQFHPEKSGDPGLRMIRNFIRRVRC